MKKDRKNNDEKLFQTISDDPRLAETVDVDETIDTNVEDLFKVVGTSDERIEKLDSTPYSYWSLTFKYLFNLDECQIQCVRIGNCNAFQSVIISHV